MAHALLRNVVQEIGKTSFFGIIADESRDISGVQQFYTHITPCF
jgi:hypothetical protein